MKGAGATTSPAMSRQAADSLMKAKSDSVAKHRHDSVAAARRDSLWQADSLNVIGARSGYVLQMPPRAESSPRNSAYGAQSWMMAAIIVLFVAVCLRVKSNAKYLRTLLRDLTEVRERGNAFDDTVRETSLLVMLSLLWSACTGVILYYLLLFIEGSDPAYSFGISALHTKKALSMAVCSGVCLIYTIFMTVAYYIVGNVFSDRRHTTAWIKGYLSEQGLTTIAFIPLSLLAVCRPDLTPVLLIISGIVFLLGKIIFIIKGFRIFFTQISSWVLFLYYLCSLEIVPLVMMILLSIGITANL